MTTQKLHSQDFPVHRPDRLVAHRRASYALRHGPRESKAAGLGDETDVGLRHFEYRMAWTALMRRPHVYERSAPRSSRPSYQEPSGDRSVAARDVAYVLPGLLAKAEASGLRTLAGLLQHALEEAELEVRRHSGAPVQRNGRPADHETDGSDVEGLLRVLDATALMTSREG